MKPDLRLIPAMFLLAGCGYGLWHWLQPPAQSKLVASGTLEASEVHLAARLSGRILKIPVSEGQNVKSGQTLLQIDTRELQAQLRQTQAQQRAAQSQVNLIQAGARHEDLAAAEAAVHAADLRIQELLNGSRQQEKARAAAEVSARTSQLELARIELKRSQELVQAQAAPPQTLDQARNAVNQAEAALRVASQNQQLILAGSRAEEVGIAQQQALQQQAQLRKLRNGPRSEEIQVALAQRDQVQAQADQLEIRLADGVLRAPCACRISLIATKPGELTNAGSPLITLLDPQDLWVRVYLSPLELNQVRLNQPVSLIADAWPKQIFRGKVVYISPVAEFTPRNVQTREERVHQVFAVKVAVTQPDGRLFAGMPVDVLWDQPQTAQQKPVSTQAASASLPGAMAGL